MIIEVRPGPMSNKGGELMLRAVVDRLGGAYDLATEPWIGPYRTRARLGLLQKAAFPRLGRFAELPGRAIPAGVRRRYGIVTSREIAAVLDASGFAFGDQFGLDRVRRLSTGLVRAHAAGQSVVMLPQAFGPFRDRRIASATMAAVEAADLVFARDATSLEHLLGLGLQKGAIRQAPDFTGAQPGIPPPDATTWSGRLAIVPNERMLSATEADVADAYVPFLASVADAAMALDLEPVLLIHESSADGELASRVAASASGPILICTEEDPLRLKGMLTASRVVVASRYHAVAGALSAAVPVLSTAWSHKYAELLGSYDATELLIEPADLRTSPLERLASLATGPEREGLVRRLAAAGRRLEHEVDRMWAATMSVLEGRRQGA